MRKILLTILFFQLLVSSVNAIKVVYPLHGADSKIYISNPLFDTTFLEFLKEKNVYVLMDTDGKVISYYSENKEFGCVGICEKIEFNNYVFSSGNNKEPVFVIGNKNVDNSIKFVNAIRAISTNSPIAGDEFERYLLNSEDVVKYNYLTTRYESVWKYAENILKKDMVYTNILSKLKVGDVEGARNTLKEFFSNNFNINKIYDLQSLYTSLNTKNIGEFQTDVLIENILKKIAEENNIDIEIKTDEDIEKMLSMAENILGSEDYSRIKEIVEEIMKDERARNIFRKLLENVLSKLDWETVLRVMKILAKSMLREEMLSMIIDGIRDYMRNIVKDEKFKDMLNAVQDETLKATLNGLKELFSENFFDTFRRSISNIPEYIHYFLLFLSLIMLIVVLKKMGV